MKKMMFFWLSLIMIGLTACVDYPEFDFNDIEEEIEEEVITTGYFLKVNGKKIADNDTLDVLIKETTLIEMFDVKGLKVEAVYRSSHQATPITTGTICDVKYSEVGIYKVTASLIDGTESRSVWFNVYKESIYTLLVDGDTLRNGDTLKTVVGRQLKFKVVDDKHKAFKTTYDFGNGDKISSADSVSMSYDKAGNYTLKTTTNGKIVSVRVEVVKESSQSIRLITSSFSGTTITATLGIKASIIPNYSSTKKTWVTGEIPGTSWKLYEVTEKITVNSTEYYKWNITVPVGKFRINIIQLKDGEAETVNSSFNYDGCNWGYDPESEYLKLSDYLYHFYLRIEDGKVIITKE